MIENGSHSEELFKADLAWPMDSPNVLVADT